MIRTIKVLLSNVVGPVIELPTAMGEIDLHNFADFVCLEYKTDGSLRLVWKACEEGKFNIGNYAISRAALLFDQVIQFKVTPRDPEMPMSEDRTMEDFEVEGFNEKHYHFRFRFHGGIEVEVIAACVNLEVAFDENGGTVI
jgi:hypothetical protein